MANFVERAVVDPNYWLAQADLQNSYTSETPFIERAAKEARKSFSDFRKNHSIEIKPPVGMMRLASNATLLALLMGIVFGPISPPLLRDILQPEDNKSGFISFKPVGLIDIGLIDKGWIENNCTGGQLTGTGKPAAWYLELKAAILTDPSNNSLAEILGNTETPEEFKIETWDPKSNVRDQFYASRDLASVICEVSKLKDLIP